MDGARIFFATDILPTEDITRRVSRRAQSSAASRLLERLTGNGFNPTAQSKSHSRGIVAGTVGNIPELLLGIDIEWMAPDRPFAAIAHTFLESAPERMEPEDFYRGWTFFEAYYKAFQRFPDAASVHDVLRRASDGGVLRFHDGTQLMQKRVAETFQLCIVWRARETVVPVEVS
jgi:hypothetical protein